MPLSTLKIGSHGDEVKLLHAYLQQLGFQIDPAEQKAERYGKSTADAVAQFQTKQGLKPTGEVDAATANAINAAIEQPQADPKSPASKTDPQPPTFTVSGHVRTSDGKPLPGVTIRAYDADLPSLGQDEPLGAPATTDQDGFYQITYSAEQFSRAEQD